MSTTTLSSSFVRVQWSVLLVVGFCSQLPATRGVVKQMARSGSTWSRQGSASPTPPPSPSPTRVTRAGPYFSRPAEARLSVVDWNAYDERDNDGPGTYSFGYDIDDAASGNTQFRQEERLSNGTVTGSYGLVEPDGNVRVVSYIADALGYRVKMENSRQVLGGFGFRPTFRRPVTPAPPPGPAPAPAAGVAPIVRADWWPRASASPCQENDGDERLSGSSVYDAEWLKRTAEKRAGPSTLRCGPQGTAPSPAPTLSPGLTPTSPPPLGLRFEDLLPSAPAPAPYVGGGQRLSPSRNQEEYQLYLKNLELYRKHLDLIQQQFKDQVQEQVRAQGPSQDQLRYPYRYQRNPDPVMSVAEQNAKQKEYESRQTTPIGEQWRQQLQPQQQPPQQQEPAAQLTTDSDGLTGLRQEDVEVVGTAGPGVAQPHGYQLQIQNRDSPQSRWMVNPIVVPEVSITPPPQRYKLPPNDLLDNLIYS